MRHAGIVHVQKSCPDLKAYMKKKKIIIIIISLLVLLLTAFFSICVGRYRVAPSEVLQALLGHGSESTNLIVFKLRLPRIICSILIGSALAISGMVYQGLFQNPLVSPDILGVSSGACVGAVASIMLGLGSSLTMLFAFSAGILSVAAAIILSVLTKKRKNIVMVFSGIIIGRFMSSIVGILIFFSDDESQLGAIIEWEMGSFAKVTSDDLIIFGPLLVICILVLLLFRWRVNLISVGEEEAKALGVNVIRERLLIICFATLATAISVCVAGTIAWIGLIIPHICRWIIKDDNRYSMPLSVSLGAIALLLSDTIARSLLPYELPLEVITGLVGAPVFAWIMVKRWRD